MAPNPIAARLLDLTRLVSRMGRGPMTGIDRVEHAYLLHLLDSEVPLFGLVRTGFGYALLDRVGMAGIARRVRGAEPLGEADLLARLAHRRNPVRARAEADVRRLALARAARPFLRQMLLRHLPAGTSYLNTGHANLTLQGTAVASDAFFPFRDGLDVVVDAGASCVIQPGGSMRDQEVIDAADERGVVMVYSGVRHFRH